MACNSESSLPELPELIVIVIVIPSSLPPGSTAPPPPPTPTLVMSSLLYPPLVWLLRCGGVGGGNLTPFECIPGTRWFFCVYVRKTQGGRPVQILDPQPGAKTFGGLEGGGGGGG